LTTTLDFLRRDPLRNIVPLKMLTAHPTVIDIHYAQEGEATGVLLLFPTAAFAYDRQTYPDDDLIALVVATMASLVPSLLNALPRDRRVIFKLVDPAIQAAVGQQLPLTRLRAFHSFTAPAARRYRPHPAVVESNAIDAQLLPHLAPLGHEPADLAHYFGDGLGRAFTCYADGAPIAGCFTFQNFATVHEIGGVFTLPAARRMGYAKQVVESAVASLQQRGYIPRYQVHEANLPSIALAQAIGLERFAIVDHWRYQPA
jgi:GNAT superfamily N-acetyltransferase